MAEGYLITGVQLGMLIALENKEEREQLANNILDIQYIKRYFANIVNDCIVINTTEVQNTVKKISSENTFVNKEAKILGR